MSQLRDTLSKVGPCIVKSTRDTSSGRDVYFANFAEGSDRVSGLDISELIAGMGKDWVCQEVVRQHESIASIYPDSVNTLRIVTYLTNDGVGVCPVALRLGQGGAKVDNAHQGGMFIHVGLDGSLAPEAYTEYQRRYFKHPDTGVVFDGYRIKGVRSAVEACMRQHLAVGEFGFLSWDVCVGEDEIPVLVEVNLVSQSVWFPQMASGEAMFGDDTPAVIGRYRKRKEYA